MLAGFDVRFWALGSWSISRFFWARVEDVSIQVMVLEFGGVLDWVLRLLSIGLRYC